MGCWNTQCFNARFHRATRSTRLADVCQDSIKSKVFLILHRHVTIELGMCVVDRWRHHVTNQLCCEHGTHKGHDVVQFSCELEHDYHQGNCHATEARKHADCTYHCEHSWFDVHRELGHRAGHSADKIANEATQGGANIQRWNEETTGNGRAKGVGCLNKANCRCNQQPDIGWKACIWHITFLVAKPKVMWPSIGTCLEQGMNGFGVQCPQEAGERKAQQGSHQSKNETFQDVQSARLSVGHQAFWQKPHTSFLHRFPSP
mmetsp:Transcript_11985/g.26425  ORF Transcript_11985/g.26425 Transcript_11985/m.26425 type:complete len:260 (-) Transcript_11985:1142-1921(-)